MDFFSKLLREFEKNSLRHKLDQQMLNSRIAGDTIIEQHMLIEDLKSKNEQLENRLHEVEQRQPSYGDLLQALENLVLAGQGANSPEIANAQNLIRKSRNYSVASTTSNN